MNITLEDVKKLVELTKDIKHCYSTATRVYDLLNPSTEIHGAYDELIHCYCRILSKEAEKENADYIDYVLTAINRILFERHYVFIHLTNGDGTYGSHSFDHAFILVRISDGNVYRIESYADTYKTRYVPFNDYVRKLKELLPCRKQRISLWNNLFDCEEKHDIFNGFLEVELFTETKTPWKEY